MVRLCRACSGYSESQVHALSLRAIIQSSSSTMFKEVAGLNGRRILYSKREKGTVTVDDNSPALFQCSPGDLRVEMIGGFLCSGAFGSLYL